MSGPDDRRSAAGGSAHRGGIWDEDDVPRATPGANSSRPSRDGETTYHYVAAPRPVETGLIYEPPPPQRRRWDRSVTSDIGIVIFLIVAVVAGYFTWTAMGRLTDALASLPKPSPTVAVSAAPSDAPSVTAAPSAPASEDPSPSDVPSAAPVRVPVDVNLVSKPKKVFLTEQEKTWCAASAVQIVLNINSGEPDLTRAFQLQVHQAEVDYTTYEDSHNGGAGPQGMVETLNQMGTVPYELKIYGTREIALRAAAKAISSTDHPVILLAWRGAHAWVMSGYTADADPTVFKDAVVDGAYILDPWYPRVSSIWGPSDPPGAYQDASEMVRNFLKWRRPEGRYPGRDGKFLVIVPAAP